ncbi:MAG TPA: anaerobic ribonucleoside-triphosphate reductase activating protein [Treponema sp.]|nr:anaerobic ribonucleoside-triphosphate reductase activating protein [Treponema sp.]
MEQAVHRPELLLNVPAGALIKTTLVDFPGRVASTFFLKGCNLRCPYCYNTGLVLGGKAAEGDELSTIEELFAHLELRKNMLTGLVVSGGEPLVNPLTPYIIERAKKLGYRIKLDTNGTLPGELEKLLKNKSTKPDFIAMDIKTNPARYAREICMYGSVSAKEDIPSLLARSAELVASYPADSREWRTVLVPSLVTKADIAAMAVLLPKDASWQFAQFRNENCLDPSYNNIPPYVDAELKEFVDYARTFIPGAALR